MSRTNFRDFTTQLYEIISSPAGSRDWDTERALFHADARLVRTGLNADGSSFAKVMSVEEFIENVEATLSGVEFSETEIRHEVTIFGNVAQVASYYEKSLKSDTEESHGRGVNFFNIVYNGSKWLIMSVIWDNERDGLSLTNLKSLVA